MWLYYLSQKRLFLPEDQKLFPGTLISWLSPPLLSPPLPNLVSNASSDSGQNGSKLAGCICQDCTIICVYFR